MAASLRIQPSFIKHATKAELKSLNRMTSELLSMAWDVGASRAVVMKNKNGRDGERRTRVQFVDDNCKYISGIYI